ncbi:MAG TPA: selenocysteine-specific translation elongation factor, partial [Patescibacteria group bacterium]|nr:selenocysteine-specific translation elongation factor [Patescibacteria group bacterium]
MKYIIIGTAGHVDHGKTAVIKALTGTDTDRLKEEKQRGISIDLGFAALELTPDLVAGIVDVPGHERFLKNMLAGSGGVDLAMLVIAADEGVMPQTREHLAMLQLYGIRQGVVVLNKADKVDADWLDLMEEEVRSLLKDTFLAAAPFCRVSAISGEGIPELRQQLTQLALQTTARDDNAPFRLWIDRVFSIKGHGAVVTGSVLGGRIKIGDSVMVYPGGRTARIRGLEWHGQKTEEILAGQRAAVNLTGVEMEELGRGMFLSAPERGQTGLVWDLKVEWLAETASGTRVRLHLGTGEFLGRVYRFRNADPAYVRLVLEQPLAAGAGDRGILRLYSPQHLLGGALLIGPGRRARKLPPPRLEAATALEAGDMEELLYQLLADHRQFQSGADLKRLVGYVTDKEVNRALDRLLKNGRLLRLEGRYLAAATEAALLSALTAMLTAFHKNEPERSGLSKETARQRLKLEEKTWETLLPIWLAAEKMVIADGELALPEHALQHGDRRQDLTDQLAAVVREEELVNLDVALLGEKLALNPAQAKAAHDMLVKKGILVRIGDMHVYRKTIQYIGRLLYRYFQDHSELTVAEFRDLLNTSRKVALPLLEYFDTNKYTVRD